MDALKIAQKYMKQAYDFSSIQLEIPDPEASEIRDWSIKNIPNRLLANDGFENDIHVTIKYGIHIHDFTAARNLFINEHPIKIKLGKIGLFEGDCDVIKIDVISPDLHRLNKLISKTFEVTDTYPTYQPHLTLAYVLKSFGDSYDGGTDFLGREITSDSILFSGKDNRKTLFKLG